MPVVDLDYPHAKILLDVSSPIEMEKRAFSAAKEFETCLWLETLDEGQVLFDVGANVGAYSLIAAKRGLRVYSFEPHQPTFEHLVRNIALNELEDRITPLSYVVGAKDGRIGFQESSPDPGAALHRLVAGDSHQEVTLDRLVAEGELPMPDALKLDTDGNELAVVRGAGRVLSEVQSVQVEVDDALWSYEALLDSIQAHGLRIDRWTRHGRTSVSNVLFRR